MPKEIRRQQEKQREYDKWKKERVEKAAAEARRRRLLKEPSKLDKLCEVQDCAFDHALTSKPILDEPSSPTKRNKGKSITFADQEQERLGATGDQASPARLAR